MPTTAPPTPPPHRVSFTLDAATFAALEEVTRLDYQRTPGAMAARLVRLALGARFRLTEPAHRRLAEIRHTHRTA